MGTRQPARLTPRPVYGLPEVVAQEYMDATRTKSSAVLPLLVLVLGLAVATVWFVGLPAVGNTSQPARTCEVIVTKSGAPRCVESPTQAAHQKATARVKR